MATNVHSNNIVMADPVFIKTMKSEISLEVITIIAMKYV